MQKPLTPAQRQALKGRAHRLAPVVLIGAGGLTAAVSAEIERALAAHELIKIRVAGEGRAERDALLAEICERSGSAPVQHIGKTLVVYREHIEPPVPPERPAASGQPARPAKRLRPRPAARSEPRSRVRRQPGRAALQPPARGARIKRARRGKARPR
ncbi:MAG: YhbY family RNA-binding protein [Burkholderiales bacterium]|nr:YhbY family RNA-binding protein [Burkholderiales bacterium]